MRYDVYFYINPSYENTVLLQKASEVLDWEMDFDHFFYTRSGFTPQIGQKIDINCPKLPFVEQIEVVDVKYRLDACKSERISLYVAIYVDITRVVKGV